MNNPFTYGNPIREPDRFIGRAAEIRQIVNRLLSSAHESTSIMGERRIGKTSLLHHLAHPETSARLGLTPDKFCSVYVDFQGLTDITPQRFWKRVLKMMEQSICDERLKPEIQKLGEQAGFDLFDLEDIFQSITDKGMTTVLMMDEFEYITENPNFKSDFFGGLRALAIHHGLALIPATSRELVALCHSNEIKGSPFFNIFSNVVLRPFSPEEVNELVTSYLGEDLDLFTPAEQALIPGLAGGYPFFVQMAGNTLVEGRVRGLQGEALEAFVTATFDQEADPHFSYLWTHCTESEKISLLILMALGRQKRTKKTLATAENLAKLRARSPQDLAGLGKRGLVESKEGIYSLFTDSFARWIRREVLAAPGEEESQANVNAWLRGGGPKEIEAARGVFPKFKKKYWPIVADVFKELSFEVAAAGAMELIRILV